MAQVFYCLFWDQVSWCEFPEASFLSHKYLPLARFDPQSLASHPRSIITLRILFKSLLDKMLNIFLKAWLPRSILVERRITRHFNFAN